MRGMRANGSLTRHAEKENSSIPMAIFMMAPGLIIKRMDREFTQMSKELAMKATGKTINKTARVLKPGRKVLSTKESTS